MAAADLAARGVAGSSVTGSGSAGDTLAGREGPREPAPSASEQADSRLGTAEVTELGLPVRVRQASLAPQLRNSPPAAPSGMGGAFTLPGRVLPEVGGSGNSGISGTGPGDTGPGGSGPSGSGPSPIPPAPADHRPTASPIPATPEAARNVMSALQRGWQLGRSEAEAAAEPPISVFTPRKSPTGQAFGPYDLAAGSREADPADGADENGGE